jgi:protoporphyrin/coproporphyrin ferrochelatase
MIGLLLMAYGGPDNIDEVEPYLLDVRGHRPTAAHIVEEVRARYARIGGRSPILEQTMAQAAALESALNKDQACFKAFVGMRHWHPYIKDTLAEMRAAGIDRAVGLVMAPQYSRMSIGAYYKSIEASNVPMQIERIEDWHLQPGYLDALAERVRSALQRFPAAVRAEVPVVFTAHSLPRRILEWNDPYPAQLHETVEAVMERLGPHSHEFAFQSAAISSEPWLGPDASTAIARLAAQAAPGILLCPVGFVCEHVEILYDIDVVYQEQAHSLNIQLERIEMLNTAPAMINGLAQLVAASARSAGWL